MTCSNSLEIISHIIKNFSIINCIHAMVGQLYTTRYLLEANVTEVTTCIIINEEFFYKIRMNCSPD